jgi:serine/threonine protein kinase
MTPMDDAVGFAVDGLSELVEVGRGGFSVVYRARQIRFDRVVAVKVLATGLDNESQRRFERECAAVGNLSWHPHVVTLFDAGATTARRPYLVMEYAPAGSLGDRLTDGPVLDWSHALDIGVKVAGALEAAHRAGRFHRDVKPDNILVSPLGEPMLADFGIATLQNASVTSLAASLAYAAPESMDGGEPSAASDIYSLGATLFALLSGRSPFAAPGDSVGTVIRRIQSDPFPDLRSDGVPEEVCLAIEAACERDPDRRPYSAEALGEVLRWAQEQAGAPQTRLVVQPANPLAERSPAPAAPPIDSVPLVFDGATRTSSSGPMIDRVPATPPAGEAPAAPEDPPTPEETTTAAPDAPVGPSGGTDADGHTPLDGEEPHVETTPATGSPDDPFEPADTAKRPRTDDRSDDPASPEPSALADTISRAERPSPGLQPDARPQRSGNLQPEAASLAEDRPAVSKARVARRSRRLRWLGVGAVTMLALVVAGTAASLAGGDGAASPTTTTAPTSTTTTRPPTTTTAVPIPTAEQVTGAFVTGTWTVFASRTHCSGINECGSPRLASFTLDIDCTTLPCTGRLSGSPPAPMSYDGPEIVAEGALPPEAEYTCAGKPEPTTFRLRFTVTAANWDLLHDRFAATKLTGSVKLSTPATECTAASEEFFIGADAPAGR